MRKIGVVLSVAILMSLVASAGVDLNTGVPCDGAAKQTHRYQPGDRVRCIVDYPDGSDCIVIGTTGAVIGYYTISGWPPMLVQWDGITCGHDGMGHCPALPAGTGWFVYEDQVEPLAPVTCRPASSSADVPRGDLLVMAGAVVLLLVSRKAYQS